MQLFKLAAISLLVGLSPFACAESANSAAWQPRADIAAAYILTVNNAPLWQANASKRLPPASLTKLVAALVLLDNPKLSDWITISQNASQQQGTRLKLKPKQQFRAAYLMGAMLMKSANDACTALAEWDAGSEAAFVKKMNAKLITLNLKDTHFSNACGFDGVQHYSTANDLLAIAKAANAQAKIKVWAEMKDYTLQAKTGQAYSLVTSNMLLGRVEGADGLKTGFTQAAGKCLIAHGKRNNREVYLVMLNAPDRWWDADELLNRAFDEDYQ